MEIGSPPPASAMITTAANVGGGDNHAAEETPASLTVFRYEKSLLSRLHECKDVLKTAERTVPASKVREQWRYFIEMQLEPAGRIELRIFNFQSKYGFLYIYLFRLYLCRLAGVLAYSPRDLRIVENQLSERRFRNGRASAFRRSEGHVPCDRCPG